MSTGTVVTKQIQSAALPTHRRARWQLPSGVAFYLQASIITLFLAASSAPTPLYARYQAEWHFSPIGTTVAFGVYAVTVLAALLVFGRLSDHVGRRPVLLATLVVQAASMVVFATASSLDGLVVARIVQGLATGTAAGAVGAGLLDLDRTRGAIANAVAPLAGTAIGGVLAALLIEAWHAPVEVVYLAFLAAFAVQFVGVLLMGESSSRVSGALASLRPEFGLPAAVRRVFVLAMPVMLAMWALVGFFGSLGPALLRHVGGDGSPLQGGLVLFLLAGSGAVAVLLLRERPPWQALLGGTLALSAGVAVTLGAVGAGSVGAFLIGEVVAGAGFGACFQGVVRSIVPATAPHQRAGVLSSLYVIFYLAMGLTAVAAGILVVHDGGLIVTAKEYGVAVIVLALLAVPGALQSRWNTSGSGRIAASGATPSSSSKNSPISACQRALTSRASIPARAASKSSVSR